MDRPQVAQTFDESAPAILEASPDGMLLVDESGQIVLANPRAAQLFTTTVDALIDSSVDDLVPGSLRDLHENHRRGFAQTPQVRLMAAGLELVAVRADGTSFPADIALSPLTIQGNSLVLACVRDISERRVAEREMRVARERIATMEDRERIARDLHDTVIQEIFGAGLSLQGIVGRIDDTTAAQRLTKTIGHLDETITKLRTVIFDLQHPPERGTIATAIGDVIQAAAVDIGCAPNLAIRGGDVEELEAEVVEQLIPTLREALTNVAKHANATVVSVNLTLGEVLVLTLEDNGVGVVVDDAAGFGLGNMLERARSLGGTFEIGSVETGGTRLEWRVPLIAG